MVETWSYFFANQRHDETNMLCDRKYKHEVEENYKVLAAIIGTIIPWESVIAR